MTQNDHKPDYVIRKRRSSNWYWAISLLIVVALIASGLVGYWLNQKRYDFSETAEQQFNQVQASLEEANAIAVRWQQQYELEKAITKELRQHTFDLELQLHNRKKEVEAFQRVFDPDSVESGLQIASFIWEPISPDHFRYRLILSQAKTQTTNISGKYSIELIGSQEGQNKSISFNELESLTDKERQFKFKYMEVRDGLFKLPENFQPKNIRVLVTSSGRNGKTIAQDFVWDKNPTTAIKKDNNQLPAPDSDTPSGGK